MKILNSLVIAISMYSKIPMPQVEWNKENMKYTMAFFPVVGVITGVCVFFLGKLLFALNCGSIFRSGVLTVLPILINGGIHMDGFMDTMDALASYGNREKKLEILKDSHAGAFAILGVGCYLVLSFSVWSEVTEQMLCPIAFIYILSRILSGISVVAFPSARENGLAKTFQEQAEKRRVKKILLVFFGMTAIVLCLQNARMAAGIMISVLLVFFYYRKICIKQFGGVTGDLAGWFLQISELAMLVGALICGGGLWS